MEKKKRIRYGWQTFLLCVVVSISPPVLAKSSRTSSSTKDSVRKSLSAKHLSTTNAASRQSSVSAHRRPTKSESSAKTSQRIVRDVSPSSRSKDTSRKDKKPVTASVKPRRTEQPRVAREATHRRASHSKRASQWNDVRQTKSASALPNQDKRRFIMVIKETKRHKMEKVTIEVPHPRLTLPSSQKIRVEARAAGKSQATTRPQERAVVMAAQKPQAPLSPPIAGKPEPPVVSTPLQPQPPPLPQPQAQQPNTQPAVATLPSVPAAQTSVATIKPVPQDRPPLKLTMAKPNAVYSPQRAPFAAAVNDEPLSYRINSLFVLPGDEIFLAISDSQRRAEYSVRSTWGVERVLASRRWYWTAPTTPGLHQIKVTHTRANKAITLNVFVMVPLDRVDDGYLNGYRIGHYPTEPLRQLPMYNRPRGFVEVTPENEDMLVSPHFQLSQFLCKQDGGYPKYLILDARLVTTLEQLLEMINANGYKARTLRIMSGYRTPYYNRAIGNRTTYSRHLWGDAADIFVDEEPLDGKMDDLNQDGVIDAHDADVIYQLIENASEPRIQKIMMGGLARYRETSSHGPFIHVDARGSYARWGLKTLTRGGTTSTEAAFGAGEDALTRPSFSEPSAEDSAP